MESFNIDDAELLYMALDMATDYDNECDYLTRPDRERMESLKTRIGMEIAVWRDKHGKE